MKPTPVSRQFLNLLLASLWCAASCSASAAQTIVNTGTVRGVVSDKSGADPITAINPSFVGIGHSDFGVADGVQLPTPNAPFPVPGTLTTPDPNNPAYLTAIP
jgi:hypothetical protein